MSKAQKILLINHYAGSRTHGMEFRPYYLARAWQELGCQTTIVAASFSHLRQRSPRLSGPLLREHVEGVPYFWLRTGGYHGNGLGRVLNWCAFVAGLHRHQSLLLRQVRPDVVISSSTYPLANLPAFRLARRARARCVYEVRDLWPLTLIELQGLSRWHPFALGMQWAENLSYRNADLVTCTLPKAASHMIDHGLDPSKFAYIPHGVAVEEWQAAAAALPVQHADCLSRLRAQRKFLIGYTGAHGKSNALEYLVDAATILRQYPVAFVLVGQGPEKPRLEERARERRLANTIFLPPVSKDHMPALLGWMDACFLGWQKKPIYRFGISPNKLLDYMLAGKPIVHSTAAPEDPVLQSRCGLSVPAENPERIADAINRMANLSCAERQSMGERGRRYVQSHHDYRVLGRQYLELLQDDSHGPAAHPTGNGRLVCGKTP